jgi:hypothetical protein
MCDKLRTLLDYEIATEPGDVGKAPGHEEDPKFNQKGVDERMMNSFSRVK